MFRYYLTRTYIHILWRWCIASAAAIVQKPCMSP